MNLNKWFVFDVESMGLYGEPYAVGWSVWHFYPEPVRTGEVDFGLMRTDPRTLEYTQDAFEWFRTNVPDMRFTHLTQHDMLEDFWQILRRYMSLGYNIAAECPVPVESNFLRKCVDNDPVGRNFLAPYPLVDISSIMLCKGIDPMLPYGRLQNELPVHNPLCDARQSARLLRSVLC